MKLLKMLVVAIVIGILGFSAAKPVSHAKNLQTPMQQGNDEPTGDDRGVIDAKVATIDVGPTLSLAVYPSEPAGNVRQRNPFFYEVHPVISFRSTSFYDSETRLLEFDIALPKITDEEQLAEARREVVLTIDGNAEEVSLLPLKLEAYQVYIEWGTQQRLMEQKLPGEGGPFDGLLRIGYEVQDEVLHKRLQQDPASITISFRPFYRFRVFDVTGAIGQLRSALKEEVTEDIFGAGAPGNRLVSRTVMNELKRQSLTTVNIILPSNASDVQLSIVNMIERELDKLQITPEEVREAQASYFYRAENVQLEITPEVFSELLTEWSSAEEFRQSFQETWDNLRELQDESTSSQQFFEKLQGLQEGGGKHAGKAGLFDIFDIEQDWGVDFKRTWDEQTNEQKEKFEKFQERVKTTGSVSEETLKNIAEEFTGQRELSWVNPSDLDIYRLSRADLEAVFQVAVSQIIRLESIFDERTKGMAFVGPETMVSVDLENLVGELTPTVAQTLQADAQFRAMVTGPKGDKGDKGDKGNQGDKGNKGVQGPPGPVSIRYVEEEHTLPSGGVRSTFRLRGNADEVAVAGGVRLLGPEGQVSPAISESYPSNSGRDWIIVVTNLSGSHRPPGQVIVHAVFIKR